MKWCSQNLTDLLVSVRATLPILTGFSDASQGRGVAHDHLVQSLGTRPDRRLFWCWEMWVWQCSDRRSGPHGQACQVSIVVKVVKSTDSKEVGSCDGLNNQNWERRRRLLFVKAVGRRLGLH